MAAEHSSKGKAHLSFDLNSLPQPEPLVEMDNFRSISDPGLCIDWGRISIHIAEDGRLTYVNREPTAPAQGHEFHAALQEAEAVEDARRIYGDVQDNGQNVDDDLASEDEGSLWFHK